MATTTTTETLTDANSIAELIGTSNAKLEARAKPPDGATGKLVRERPGVYDPRAGFRVMPRPAPTVAEHEALPAKAPSGPVIPAAPMKRPAVAGLPDPEENADLIASRANYSRLAADLTAAFAERVELEKELGLATNATAAALEKRSVELLVNGGDYARVQLLKSVAEREKHLASACKIAADRIHPLLQEASRKLSSAAVASLVRPAQESFAIVFVELLAKFDAVRAAKNKVRAAGLGCALNEFSTSVQVGTTGLNETAAYFIREKLLTREQVLAVAPLLEGI